MKTAVYLILVSIIFATLLSCNRADLANNKESKTMNVKVVSLEKCNATPPTIALVKEMAKEIGININFSHAIVKNQDDANKHRHIGSPTVQINGLDIDPGARDIEQFGVTWRRYGASSMPSKELIKSAYKEALENG